MRHALLAAGLALLAAHAAALDLADPAPPLSVTTWVQGGPVDLATLRGKGIAVVAFWATWCAPSERAIETLASLQREHAGHGLVVVGVTVADPNNDLAKVRAFVEKKGPVLPYAVGFDDGETTWRDWMVASGAKSVSTGFLVDREGRIAWIGDPQRGLERAVADLLAGRHSAERARRIKDLERRFDRAAASSDWAAALAAADELVADAPGRGNARRCHAHLRMGRPADALAAAKSAVEALEDAETLVALARSLAGHRAEGRPFEDLAIRALDRAI
ncbi:MAG: TlpA family protein disulfide reductase, partial [Planctomycetes bacterium]|nr:TlpA family protein disulfide reductase [Planctomycetota bacterium]